MMLCEPTDAYEWSFVAVPAQKNAGVTKHFSEAHDKAEPIVSGEYVELEAFKDTLRRDVVRLSFLSFPQSSQKAVERITEEMTVAELVTLKKELSSKAVTNAEPQISVCEENDGATPFKLRKEDTDV